MMLDNREWASLIWLGIFFAWRIFKKENRSNFSDVPSLFLEPKIIISVCAMLGYVALEISLGSKLSLWRSDLLKPTFIWLVVSGFALFFSFDKASEDPHFFRSKIIGSLKITVLLEFFLNLSVLSFIGEFILQPVLFVLTSISLFADSNDYKENAKNWADRLLAIIGFSLLFHTTWELYSNWDEINKHSLILQFALPLWLTFGFLPFIYFLALYTNYSLAFSRIGWETQDRMARWRAKLVLLSKLNFKNRDIHGFDGYWTKKISSVLNFSAAWQMVTQFQKEKREEEQAKINEVERLRRYAGSEETDAEGRRLDRREFKETIELLHYLAICQSGWYQKPENRYRPDLMDMIVDFTRYGLSSDPGITMEVSEDGQAWYAWRRTISGWCFAIGASGPPPDQWEYDGPEPPGGYPGKNQDWGKSAFSDEVNPNWIF